MDPVEEAARLLARARHAIAFTGAGVSTPSGIPDFRGPGGLWRRVPPRLFEIDYFLSHPDETWRVFLELYESMAGVEPNPAHYAIAALEEAGVIKAVVTQNIDGLHQRAGSRRVIELHGSLEWARCVSCGRRVPLEEAVREARERRGAPRCPSCGDVLKPDVVFFGEPLPLQALLEAYRLARESDVVLVAGTSLYVAPANQVPVVAREHGARVIVVNMGDLAIPWVADVLIEAPVEEALPAICERVLEELGLDPSRCRGGKANHPAAP